MQSLIYSHFKRLILNVHKEENNVELIAQAGFDWYGLIRVSVRDPYWGLIENVKTSIMYNLIVYLLYKNITSYFTFIHALNKN